MILVDFRAWDGSELKLRIDMRVVVVNGITYLPLDRKRNSSRRKLFLDYAREELSHAVSLI